MHQSAFTHCFLDGGHRPNRACALQGGAIHSTSVFVASKSSFNRNSATGVQYFCGGCGGANTPVSGCPNQTCTGQRETCHKCFGQGGALALFGAVPPIISDTIMHNNTADNYGGAVYLDGAVSLSCHQCQIFDNWNLNGQDNVVGPPVNYTCDPGFKTGNSTVPICAMCGVGQISAGTDPFCSVCPVGMFQNHNRCDACPADKFQNKTAQTSCRKCAVCAIGLRVGCSVASSGFCPNICLPGHFVNSSIDGKTAGICTVCPAGKYQANTGMSS